VPAERLFVVPFGVRAQALPEARFVPRSGCLRIASVGRLESDAKGADRLVPIAAALARLGVDFRLDVVGDGPFRATLERAVDAAGLGARVVLRGAASRAAVREILLGSDVFLFPSRTEGFGLALLEAMEAGCAPVATRIPEVTDVLLAEGAGLLVEGGRPAAFAEAIRSLAARVDERTAMAARARDRAVRVFSLERMGNAYAALLARMAELPERRPPARDPRDLRAPWAWRFGAGKVLPARLKHALRAAAFRVGVTL
jgi:glycosyltransferase involved in cell wall biosynthesis